MKNSRIKKIYVKRYFRRNGTPVRSHTRKIKKRVRKTFNFQRHGLVFDENDRMMIIALNAEQQALDNAWNSGKITMEEYKGRTVAVQDSIYSFYDKYYDTVDDRDRRSGLWDPVAGKLIHSFKHDERILKRHDERAPSEFLVRIDGNTLWITKHQLDTLIAEHNRPVTILTNNLIAGD